MAHLERPRTVMMTKSVDEHLGISIAEISGSIMVQRVSPNSLANSFGIKVGDQILEVGFHFLKTFAKKVN